MTNILNKTIAGVVFSSCLVAPCAYAQSNSKGAKSSVVVGILKEFNTAEGKFKVLQSGELLRELHTDSKSKVYFVGITDEAARKSTVGYGIKASCDQDGRIKTISFTPPISEPRPLGEQRLSMTATDLFGRVDADKDGRIGYGEFSCSVFHSPKHGPDHFRKADGDGDGDLDPNEFLKALETVSWWTLSRKTAEAWFQEADADSNGTLSSDEFAHICTSGNHIDNVFKRTDRDKSGQLSAGETAAYIRGVTHGIQKSKKKRNRSE